MRTRSPSRQRARASRIAGGWHPRLHADSYPVVRGPDAYARIGGLETRVAGLCERSWRRATRHISGSSEPEAPGYEQRAVLHLHRWCQWLSHYHPMGVYDGQESKVPDYAASLPPKLVHDVLARTSSAAATRS